MQLQLDSASSIVDYLNNKTVDFSHKKRIFAQSFQEYLFHNHKKANMLSDKLKELRKQQALPQRKVAAALDIDTATYCKIENGNYSPKREQVVELANILHTDEKELLTLWLADNIVEVAEHEIDIAPQALQIVNETLTNTNK